LPHRPRGLGNTRRACEGARLRRGANATRRRFERDEGDHGFEARRELGEHPVSRERSTPLDVSDLALVHADARGELLLSPAQLATTAIDLRRVAEVVAERVRLSLRLGPGGDRERSLRGRPLVLASPTSGSRRGGRVARRVRAGAVEPRRLADQ